MFKLVIEDDESKTTVVPLIRDEITIGRKEGNTIRLTERNVSRRHARLMKANGGIFIEDLGSYNGVKVNGGKIQGRTPVREGDKILIGDYNLWIQVDRAASAGPGAGAPALNEAPTAAVQRQTGPTGAAARAPGPQLQGARHARLVILNSNLAGLDFAVEKPEVVIGRTDDNDIVINHRSISRNHAKLVLEGDTHKIVDLGSANGVRVNGEDYGKVELRKGDIIELGHVKVRFVAPGEPFVFDPRVDKLADAPSGRPPVAIIGAVAAVVVAAGVGAFLFLGNGSGKTGGGGGGEDKPTKKDTSGGGGGGTTPEDPGGDLGGVRKLVDARRWKEASDTLDKSGATGSDGDALRKTIDFEKAQSERYERFITFVEEGNDFEAYGEGSSIDRKSVYWADAEPKFTTVRSRLLKKAVDSARAALEAGDAEGARKSIDEAKIYVPDDPEIGRLEDELKKKGAAPPGGTAGPKPPPPKTARVDPGPKPPPRTTAPTPPPPATGEPDAAGGHEAAKEEYTKGLRLFATSHMPEAIAAFKKAIKFDARFGDPHRALGSIYVTNGNLKGMCKEFKMYVKLSPHAGDAAKIKAEMAKYAATVPECRLE